MYLSNEEPSEMMEIKKQAIAFLMKLDLEINEYWIEAMILFV